jgi:peptide/nickel transport system substrate-binding protein
VNAATLVTAQLLRQAGMSVDVQAMDWATLTSRRPVKDPPDQGGWNLFHTWSIGADVVTPVTNIAISAACDDAWFGWPCDEEIERLRTAWLEATSIDEQRAIVDQLQARLFEFVPYVNYGRWFSPIAYRAELKGLIKAPVPNNWKIEKE